MRACRSRALPTACSRRKADVDATGLVAPIVGHVGDGNFHLVVLFDPAMPAERAQGGSAGERVSMRAIAMGGTCTGEHGIGVHKLDALVAEHGDAVALMRTIKRALDPQQHPESRQDRSPLSDSPCYTLYIGNKNYSSWSLRGWLVAKLSGEPFEEVHGPAGRRHAES